MEHPNEEIMRKAIEYGYTNRTVGCIITRDDKIIAKAGGTIFSDEHDATGHSEINAIRAACKKLGTHELKDCWLYTTYEPCPMCMSAICWAKMEGVVFAANHTDRNERWTWEIMIPSEKIVEKSEHKPRIIPNFLREESLKILRL
ncbi:MAG: nucleoside deaminase [Candidatus Woesearchaeota archaeon]